MGIFKKLALTAATFGAMASAVPASAVVTTFASFSAIGGNNVGWTKGSTTATATNGTLSQLSAAGNSVLFSYSLPYFVNNGFAQGIKATFKISGSTTNDAAVKSTIPGQGTLITQNVDSLSLSFVSQNAFTIGNKTYAAGTNLLTISGANPSTNSTISGFQGATSGAETNSTALSGHSLVYTSDVLDFSNTVNRSYSISLDAIRNGNPNAGLQANAGQALSNFRATAGGSFSSDPAPLINGVPEPAVWGMMIVGFGLVGFQSRRRRSFKSVTA